MFGIFKGAQWVTTPWQRQGRDITDAYITEEKKNLCLSIHDTYVHSSSQFNKEWSHNPNSKGKKLPIVDVDKSFSAVNGVKKLPIIARLLVMRFGPLESPKPLGFTLYGKCEKRRHRLHPLKDLCVSNRGAELKERIEWKNTNRGRAELGLVWDKVGSGVE